MVSLERNLQQNVSLPSLVPSGRQNLCSLDHLSLESSFRDNLQLQAESTAAIFFSSDLLEINGRFKLRANVATLNKYVKATMKYFLHEDEPFRNEPVAARGTGFLVGPRLLATAGHLLCPHTENITDHPTYDQGTVAKIRIVFGYKMIDETNCKKEFEGHEIYAIKKVVAFQNAGGRDWVLVKLNKEAIGRKPLVLDSRTQLPTGSKTYMLGYPLGLPIKLTIGGEILDSSNPHVISDSNEAFPANSGSPLFDRQSKKVIGIYVRGFSEPFEVVYFRGKIKAITNRLSERREALKWDESEKIQPLIPRIRFGNLRKGLSLLGRCTRVQESVLISKGFGSFNLGRESYRSDCTCCAQRVSAATYVILYKCACEIKEVNAQGQYQESSHTLQGQNVFQKDFSSYKAVEIIVCPRAANN